MADVLILSGSPRKKGNTERLVEEVCRGIKAAGGDYERIRIVDLSINPCIGCGGCNKTGICVVKDDMERVYEKIRGGRRIILASPIYFYSITAQAKAMVDRCQALWNEKRLAVERGDWQDNPERKGYLISVAATRGKRVFEGAVLTMKYACDAMGIEYGGDLLLRGIDRMGDLAGDSDGLRQAELFGRACLD